MPECQNCESTVSKTFHRVFSDNEGNLPICFECGGREEVIRWPTLLN